MPYTANRQSLNILSKQEKHGFGKYDSGSVVSCKNIRILMFNDSVERRSRTRDSSGPVISPSEYMRDEDARQSKVRSESHSCTRARERDADALRKILDNKIESPPDMNFRRFTQQALKELLELAPRLATTKRKRPVLLFRHGSRARTCGSSRNVAGIYASAKNDREGTCEIRGRRRGGADPDAGGRRAGGRRSCEQSAALSDCPPSVSLSRAAM